MKKLLKVLMVATFVCGSFSAFAPPPNPPPDPGSGGGGGGPVGAPIDGGLGILLAMGVAYGGRKFYQSRKSKKETGEELQQTEAETL